MHSVAVQFRVAGKNVPGPLGVLLQFFRVLGSPVVRANQHIGQLKQFLFQAAGQHGKAHDLDQADVLLF